MSIHSKTHTKRAMAAVTLLSLEATERLHRPIAPIVQDNPHLGRLGSVPLRLFTLVATHPGMA